MLNQSQIYPLSSDRPDLFQDGFCLALVKIAHIVAISEQISRAFSSIFCIYMINSISLKKINMSLDNGIKEKMTVIADEGLVGYVVSTTNKTAKIQTIIDSASATSCLASSTRDTMICKGTIENKPQLSASHIATDARIIQGDIG